MKSKKIQKIVIGGFALIVLLGGAMIAAAFNGPSSGAGAGAGALGVDAANDVSVGTSTTQSNTKFLVVASSTADTSNYALKVWDSSQDPLFLIRNDGAIAIGTNSFSSGAALTVNGAIVSTAPFAGTIVAGNVTAGIFASGNFAFQSSLGVNTSSNVGLPQSLSVYGGGYFSGSVGIDTTAPNTSLSVYTPQTIVGNLYPIITSQVNGPTTVGGVYSTYEQATPYGGGLAFQIYKPNVGLLEAMRISSAGSVGIGTTAPGYKLDVNGTANATGYCISGANCITSWPTSATSSQWTTSGTAIYYNTGNVGIGTTSPYDPLTVKTGTGSFGFSQTDGTVKLSSYIGTSGGIVPLGGYLGTETNNPLYFFTGDSAPQMTIATSGYVGIGTTSPAYKLDVASGGSTTARIGTGSSDVLTVGGGAGKVTAGTFDPAYTIDGQGYATYLPGITGEKEETAGTVTLTPAPQGGYQAVLDFGAASQGSDLWLWRSVIDPSNNFGYVSVMLTPGFDGNAWYTKDAANNQIVIHGSAAGEVSYQLTANRFDWQKWQNETGEAGGLQVPGN